jgi:RimJ/RimL family protein N-acetyltransferase
MVESGTAWVFKIIPDEADASVAGTVCLWENSWRGETISEIGWMVLPQLQGRGLGSKAVRAILDKARSERRCDVIHAFPSTSNAPSNAVCRKMGFSRLEECDLEYAGGLLRCNHWRLDLR